MRVASIKRRILADPTTNLAYKNAKRVSLGMRCILDSVLELVAASPDHGRWQPNPELDGDESLAEKVARHADALDALSDVEGALIGLARLRLIAVTESGGIAIPALLRSQSTNAGNGSKSVGKPRRGESAEAYQRRTAEHQAAMEAQGNLMLSVVGGNMPPSEATEVLAQALRARMRVVGVGEKPVTQSVTQPSADWVTETLTQTAVDASVLGYVPPEPHAVVVVAALDSEEVLTATTTTSLLPSAPASAQANPEPNLAANPEPNPTGNPNPEPKPPTEAELEQAAVTRLCEAGHRKNGWNRQERAAAPTHMRGYLRDGFTEAQVLELILGNKKVVNGAGWYGSGPLQKAYRDEHKPAAASTVTQAPVDRAAAAPKPQAPPRPRPEDHPRILENPAWEALGTSSREKLGAVLRCLDMPDGPSRAKALAEERRWHAEAFGLVAEAFPEVLDMVATEEAAPGLRATG